MAITYGDYLIDSGYYDITPEQERERDVEAATSIDPIIAWMVARGWLDPDAEYTTTDLIAALDDNAAPDHSPREARCMYPNTVCPHDCFRPGDCDGSCTHPAPSPVVPSGLEALEPVAFANAAFFTERRAEFEQNGTVVEARPRGMCMHPLYSADAIAAIIAERAWNRRAPDPVMDAVRRCAEIAHSWETTARKLAAATDMMEKRLPHLVAADMANDITASIRAEFGLLPTSET